MFTTTDTRARFEEKARSHPEPRPEDDFNYMSTKNRVDWLSRAERDFTVNGLAHEFYAVLEATFEVIGWPAEQPTTHTTVEHDQIIRIRDRAYRAWKERREQIARKGEAA